MLSYTSEIYDLRTLINLNGNGIERKKCALNRIAYEHDNKVRFVMFLSNVKQFEDDRRQLLCTH